MNRIVIIGLSGSGKSTFAHKLGKKLNRPIIHLDKEYWTSDWKKKYSSFEDWKNFQQELVKEDRWIIDGDYSNSRPIRLERANTIIFFDFQKWRCLWRVSARIFNKDRPFDKPEGIKEKVSWELIRHILTYSQKKHRKAIEQYRGRCQIFIVRNNREVNQLLEKLTN